MKKVSDFLREEREYKELSLEDIEKTTKIKKEFLVAIEEGRLHSLPSESYAMGFVKNYAEVLGIPSGKIAPLFRREYLSEKVQVVPEFRKTQHKFKKKLLFNSKFTVLFSALLIVFVYIIIQYSSLLFGPKLIVTNPKNNAVVNDNTVEVSGTTDQYATVTVDGDEAYVTIQGNFKKNLYVFEGDKTINVVAKNRFGKTTQKSVTIHVK